MTPLVIAHRGDSANAPENTLAAIRRAIKVGADGVEFDARLAKDGVPVVIHDATLKRTAALDERVADLTSAELQKVDVGSWFNAKHAGHAAADFAGETVPTLASAVEVLAAFDGLVYIELKCGRKSSAPLADAVAGLLRDSPMLPRIIIKTFRLAAISEIRHRMPNVQTAALFSPSILNILRRRSYIIEMAREFGAQQLSLHRSLVTPKLARFAHDAGMSVTLWTADHPKWIERCRTLGVGALITNYPARMLAARDEHP